MPTKKNQTKKVVSNKKNNVKKQQTSSHIKLSSLLFVLLVLFLTNIFLFINRYISAFTPKDPGDILSSFDWNTLYNFDFVRRIGDHMSGNLTVGADVDGTRLCINGACKANWGEVIGGECMRRRSGSAGLFSDDSVYYCPVEYKRLFACTVVDDQAPDLIGNWDGTNMSGSACNSSGFCDASIAAPPQYQRVNLGSDGIYLETVSNGSQEGCWQYDSGHHRAQYKLEILCCKTN